MAQTPVSRASRDSAGTPRTIPQALLQGGGGRCGVRIEGGRTARGFSERTRSFIGAIRLGVRPIDVLVFDTSVIIDLVRAQIIEWIFALPFCFVVLDVLFEKKTRDYDGERLGAEAAEYYGTQGAEGARVKSMWHGEFHARQFDRPPEVFGGTVTLHFGPGWRVSALLPVIPPK